MQVNIHEAKTQLSKLLEKLESGAEKEIIIARAGKPVARLSALTTAKRKRTPGTLAGQGEYWEAPDCWEPEFEDAEFIEGSPLLSEDPGEARINEPSE